MSVDGHARAERRLNPSIFDREFYHLRAIQQSVEGYIAEFGGVLRGGRVLDFGAHDTPYRPLFERAGISLVASDIPPVKSPEVLMIDPASGRVDAPDGSFDGLISTQVLEHVPDVRRYLEEAMRVLKPGAPMLLTTHGTFVLHRHPTDMRRWTVDGIRYEAEQAGWDVVRVDPAVGLFATTTHLRLIAYGAMLRRVPVLSLLRYVIYPLFSVRMMLEDALLPRTYMDKLPELVLLTARRPAAGAPALNGASPA
jgi:SAM-dependent methyltransferase